MDWCEIDETVFGFRPDVEEFILFLFDSIWYFVVVKGKIFDVVDFMYFFFLRCTVSNHG